MKGFAACVVAVLFLVPVVFAQDATPRREPPVALLSLVVTDSHGNHIQSLTKEDFQVSIGGTPVDVEKFSERGGAGAPAAEMRRIGVLFDTTPVSPEGARRTAEALHGFLVRTLRPGDLAAILSGGQSLRALTGWTADQRELDAALEKASGSSATPRSDRQSQAEKRIRELANDIRQSGVNTFYTFDALVDAARA
ncbi:MAG: hypothetical protein ACRD3J_11175, partial [Thermoanaerobaculia bacterium]